ncbi:PAS domain S-box protein [Haloplanus natans]|uniref:PAS domain S-box protein n=1 Tax=Haloplanus natans TaxID=376171 RepID=UPI0006777F94|nr:PAS domain S-box protein [Haloplanus natans]
MSIDDPAEIPSVVRGRGSINVLHVDDDGDLLQLAATVLERQDDAFRVLTETTVDDALDRLETDAVDCIVSDYEMPGRDGLDFLRAVRERDPAVPFILFTGKGSEEIASEAISAGVTEYLQKGPGIDQYTVLANRIENAVSRHDAEQLVRRAYGAMDTAREGIALLDEDGYFQYVNQAYADIVGYDRSALIGTHWELLYPDAHVDRMYDEILPAVPRDGRWSGQTVYERADGDRILTNHALAYTGDGTMICLVQEPSDDGGADGRGLHRNRPQLARPLDDLDEYAVLTLDDDGYITGWNDGAERLFGYADRGVLGDHASRLYPAASEAERLSTLLNEARASGTAEDEGPHVRENGDLTRAHTAVVAVDDGHPGFVAICRECETESTPTTVYERVLRDALDDVFYVLDTAGNAVYVNEPELTGDTRAELEAMDPVELFDAADRESVVAGVRHALEHGSDERELRLRTAGGEGRTYEFCSWTLPDEGGEPYRIVGIARDISERKDRERALNELHRTTRELLRADSTATVADMTVDALADILTLGHAAVHYHDEEASALVPAAWTSRVEDVIGEPPDLGPGSIAWEAFETNAAKHYADLDDAESLHNESTPLRSEYIVPLGDHGVVLVASTEPDAFDENERRLVQLLCENVTAAIDRVAHEAVLREREAELERENQRLDEFASLVSHDLRNPLNVAGGHLELATETCDSPHIDEATRALGRMETLIDDVLTLAREGESVEEAEPVDLSRVAERCWANVETGDATLDRVDDRTIRADESRLAQVLENLFRNSVEHGARPDEEFLTVTVGTVTGPDGDARGFYVEDDGVGIPPDEREQVFEAGYSTDDGGTGFGLRIVRDIACAHGWTVDCTAGSADGARFEITGVDVA